MKRWPFVIFTLVLLTVGSLVQAEDPGVADVHVRLGLGLDWIGRKDANPEAYQWNPAWGAELGGEWGLWGASLEWRREIQNTAEGTLRTEMASHQLLIWGRRHFPMAADWMLWLGVGAGQRWEKVAVEVQGQRSDLSTDPGLVSGGAIGVGYQLLRGWRLDLQGKALKTQTRLSWETSASVGISRIF